MPIPTPPAARVHDFTVIANEPVAEGVFRLTFEAPRLAAALKPGQFVNIAVPGDATQLIRIPVSFSDVDVSAGTVETYYAVVGDGTRRLSEMVPGSTSTVLGPGGNGWRVPKESSRALLVSGGIGITPIVAAARMLEQAGVAHDAVVGALTASKLCGIDALEERGTGEVRVTTDDGTRGTKGFVTAEVEPLLASGAYDLVLTCGPEPMMRAVATLAERTEVACQVSVERMMTCGFGACNTCNVETTSGMVGACTAGPVFDAKRVVW